MTVQQEQQSQQQSHNKHAQEGKPIKMLSQRQQVTISLDEGENWFLAVRTLVDGVEQMSKSLVRAQYEMKQFTVNYDHVREAMKIIQRKKPSFTILDKEQQGETELVNKNGKE